MALLELRNVTKVFGPRPLRALDRVRAGTGKETLLAETGHILALNDVSLSIDAGETFVVMGLSGSGKSTLIRHINRLIDPTAGSVIVDGVDLMGLSIRELVEFRRRRMSMVFQHFGLMPHRTVLDNVAYGLEVQGIRRAERRCRAAVWVENVGLAGYEQKYPSELSGGMAQRVGLARALATESDILLMDEAFSALDPLIRGQMQDQLMALQAGLKKTIVFITHDLDEALRLGDRIAILKDGVVAQIGRPADILLHPADAYVRSFVKDVNRARVLTVETVMRPPPLRLTDETLEQALAAMQRRGAEIGYVVRTDGTSGVVTRAAVSEAIAGPTSPTLSEISVETPAVSPGTSLAEALPTALAATFPVPVVGPDGRLAGVLAPAEMGDALAPPAVDATPPEGQASPREPG